MLLICLKIFSARIIDVSLGTIRTIFFVKGKSIEPFLIAFIEVLIWYYIAREAINISNGALYIGLSYALGYATGTYIGSKISKVLINGYASIQVVSKSSEKIINTLRKKGFRVSIIELKNDYDDSDKDMIYIEVREKSVNEVSSIIKSCDDKAFIVVNETKHIYNGFIK